MESRIAIIGIIVEDIDASSKVNDFYMIMECIFWKNGDTIPREGLTLSASQLMHQQDIINTLAGKLGKVEGISAKQHIQRCKKKKKKLLTYCIHLW